MTQHKFCIAFGTALSAFAVPFSSIFSSFILGAAGALGAWLATTFLKWLVSQLKKKKV